MLAGGPACHSSTNAARDTFSSPYPQESLSKETSFCGDITLIRIVISVSALRAAVC